MIEAPPAAAAAGDLVPPQDNQDAPAAAAAGMHGTLDTWLAAFPRNWVRVKSLLWMSSNGAHQEVSSCHSARVFTHLIYLPVCHCACRCWRGRCGWCCWGLGAASPAWCSTCCGRWVYTMCTAHTPHTVCGQLSKAQWKQTAIAIGVLLSSLCHTPDVLCPTVVLSLLL